MASNPLPAGLPQLLSLAEDMADGLDAHEVTVGVKQNTEVVLRADIAAVRAAEAAFGTTKTGKAAANDTLRIADSNARAFLKSARVVLAKVFGEDYNSAWEAAGFPNDSTAIPGTQEERMNLCAALATHFTAHPTQEVADPRFKVTAAEATLRFDALSDARSAGHAASTLATQKKAPRDAAVEALRTRMRGLISELNQLLGDSDPRWDAFGLNAPGAVATPDTPEALLVTPGAPGILLADWADARLAARYRVWIQIMGVDAEFRPAATVTDSDATLSGLGSGKTVRVRVTALNDAGESTPSATVEVVTL